jgi:CheY-like chemotaxis protein
MAERNETRLPGTGKRVLIVNDTQEILELFRDILADLGFDVVLMSFAPRELEQVRMAEPDLIILDFIFGNRELTGWQLLQKIRMDPAMERIPVIVCSAAVREVMEQQGYLTEQGVLIVLKPFTVAQLEEAVRRAAEMSDASTAVPAPDGAPVTRGDGPSKRAPRRRSRSASR